MARCSGSGGSVKTLLQPFLQMIWRSDIKAMSLLVVVSLCLLEFVLHRYSGFFRENEAALLSRQWMLLVCLSVWGGAFLYLTFSRKDWLLIVLLLVAMISYFTRQGASPTQEAITLLFGVTLGKG